MMPDESRAALLAVYSLVIGAGRRARQEAQKEAPTDHTLVTAGLDSEGDGLGDAPTGVEVTSAYHTPIPSASLEGGPEPCPVGSD